MAEKNGAVVTTNVDAKERRKIYDSMPSALQKIAEQGKDMITKGIQGLVIIRYNLGKIVNNVIEEEGTYGAGAVEKLARFWGERATTLYNLKNFAITFELPYVKEWTSKEMPDGRHLTETHWLALTGIEKTSDREHWLKECVKKGWSAQQLEDEIRAGAVKMKNARSGGRRPNTPTSSLAGLQKLNSLVLGLSNYIEVAEKAVFDEIDEVSPDKVNEVLLERLESTKETAVTAQERLKASLEHIDQNIERVQKILEQKAEQADEAAAAEDADADDATSAPEPQAKAKNKDKAKVKNKNKNKDKSNKKKNKKVAATA